MTTDFRALCKELTNELHGYASANPYHDSDELVARARAALAKPVSLEDRIAAADAAIEASMERIRAIAAPARAALAAPEPPADGEVAELVNHLLKVAAEDESDGCTYDSAFTRRAAELLERLALQPEPPVKGEVAELVAWLRCQKGQIPGSYTEFDRRIDRAAELLEHLAPQPAPEGPSDEELIQLAFREKLGRLDSNGNIITRYYYPMDIGENVIDFARSVLARWGRQSPQPVPEGPIDGPAVQSREPASVMEEPSDEAIESWAAASSVPGEFLDPDSGRWGRCLSSKEFCRTVRAVLARWGHTPNA